MHIVCAADFSKYKPEGGESEIRKGKGAIKGVFNFFLLISEKKR